MQPKHPRYYAKVAAKERALAAFAAPPMAKVHLMIAEHYETLEQMALEHYGKLRLVTPPE